MYWIYKHKINNNKDIRFFGELPMAIQQNGLDFSMGTVVNEIKDLKIELCIPETQTGSLLDNIEVPLNVGILVSKRLQKAMIDFGIKNIQWYKASLKHINGNLVSNDYAVGNIIKTIPCVDFEKSELVLRKNTSNIKFIDKLVLKEGIKDHIFRIAEYLPLIIISNDLKKVMEANNFTGIKFLNPEELVL